jgi:predicted O-methyltransferase YrrM
MMKIAISAGSHSFGAMKNRYSEQRILSLWPGKAEFLYRITMSNKTLGLDDRLYDYLLSVSLREPEILAELRRETANHPMSMMQIAPEQGQFMALLVQLLGAKKTLEVGVFTGYSSLVVALALPADGRVVACDVSEEYTAIARHYWEKAGVADKVDLRIAPALETLDHLLATGHANRFDFAFIDADKSNYDGYYERALQLIRPGGLIAIDNVLWSGDVADPSVTDNRTEKIRALNQKLHQDTRVSLSLVPIADGLTLALKR